MDIIKDLNLSKTVYSMCFPESEKALSLLLKENDFSNLYNNTWSKKQDEYHLSYSESFKRWSKNSISFNLDYFYPTNGSSEAIREQIAYLINKKDIFVFEGEYEGYEAIVNALGSKVTKIKREDYNLKENTDKYNDKTAFFISQPSSIDGNYWENFNDFIKILENKNSDIYVDVVYIGCTKEDIHIDLTSEIIKGVFFSLSKSFGVYYHRIGGCYLKESNPLLFGNIWFKNILSMKYGETLMNEFSLGYFPNKYWNQKEKLVKDFEKEFDIKINKSESLLLINIEKNNFKYGNFFIRDENSKNIRICITPRIEKLIKSL